MRVPCHLTRFLRAVASALLLSLCMPITKAAWSTFSADGKVVYSFASKNSVESFDIAAGKTTTKTLDFPEGTPEIESISTAPDGRIWLLTKDRLWLWNAKTDALTVSETAPKDTFFHEVACHFASGRVVIIARANQPDLAEHTDRLLYKRDPGDPAMPVFVRRIDGVQFPVFLSDGTLLFGCEGDLWHGAVEFDTDPEMHRGILTAYRYAPLATRETYIGTPSQVGVSEIAVGKSKIYVHIGRMGGSGWGDFIRLDRPKRLRKGEEFDTLTGLEERLKINRAALASVEILEHDQRFDLCNSPDEHRVHFTGHAWEDGHPPHFLVGDDGKIKEVPTGQPVDRDPFPVPQMRKK